MGVRGTKVAGYSPYSASCTYDLTKKASRHGPQQVVGDSMPDRRKKGEQALPLLPRNPPRTMCPFLSDPFEECLCRNMGSLNVLTVIRICGENFESCEIYRNTEVEVRKRKRAK